MTQTIELHAIDPATAEVGFNWGSRDGQIQRYYFARKAGSDDPWVCFYDLPEDVVRALWARIDAGDLDQDDWPFEATA